MFVHQRQGSIEVICGPMFSGKTEELIRRVRRACIANQKVQVFKPDIDDRYGRERVESHSQQHIDAIPIHDAAGIRQALSPAVEVLALDEAQFLDEGILPLLDELADRGVRVIVAGLDQDSSGEPFGIMPGLLAKAEFVSKLQAICTVCGAAASRTQRLVRGGGQVLLGANETYEARCRHCHEQPSIMARALFEEELTPFEGGLEPPEYPQGT